MLPLTVVGLEPEENVIKCVVVVADALNSAPTLFVFVAAFEVSTEISIEGFDVANAVLPGTFVKVVFPEVVLDPGNSKAEPLTMESPVDVLSVVPNTKSPERVTTEPWFPTKIGCEVPAAVPRLIVPAVGPPPAFIFMFPGAPEET